MAEKERFSAGASQSGKLPLNPDLRTREPLWHEGIEGRGRRPMERNEDHAKQVGRNLTEPIDGFLLGTRYLITDRNAIFTAKFRSFLQQEGIKAARLPVWSLNLNACAERFLRTIRGSCLNRMIVFGERSLRNQTRESLEHYHHERNYQGLGNRFIEAGQEVGLTAAAVACRERLGGMLRYYYRDAALR